VTEGAKVRLGTETQLRTALFVASGTAVAYTALEFVQPPEPWYAALSLALCVAGVLALGALGFSREGRRLRLAPLSLAGAGMLLGATALMLPVLASSTGLLGWRWLPALVYAPASGIAQELVFRGTVLPVFERALPGRPVVALVCHSVMFVAWHLRTFTLVPTLSAALAVAAVTFLGGLAWGGQVQRDQTVVWSVVQHSLCLVVMSMFGWA
jgi:membrane protease YdiL (CAAX protease family)